MTIPAHKPANGHSLEAMPPATDPLEPATRASRTILNFLQQGWSTSPVRVGDRFRKAHDQFGTLWEVQRIWRTGDGLLHVRLTSLDGQGETRIVSAVTLMDTAYFLPVPTEAPPSATSNSRKT